MTEQAKMPPGEPPSDQDVQEFEEKFEEFFDNLPEREKLQAASLVTLAAKEDEVAEAEQVGENHGMERLSEEEFEVFSTKLNGFHDSLPEGQHQILDALTAKAVIHTIPEDERDDVQGNWWFFQHWFTPTEIYQRRDYAWINYCQRNGGVAYWTGRQFVPGVGTYRRLGCWK